MSDNQEKTIENKLKTESTVLKINFGVLFLGAVLVIAGLAFILSDLGYTSVRLEVFHEHLGPLALIFLGLVLIPGRGGLPVLVGTILTLLALLVLMFLVFQFSFGYDSIVFSTPVLL